MATTSRGQRAHSTRLVDTDGAGFRDEIRAQTGALDADSVLETLQSAAGATGAGVSINVKGYKSVTLQVVATSGTWGGGIQGTIDGGTTWHYLGVINATDQTELDGAATQFNPSSAVVSTLCTLNMHNLALDEIRFNIAAWTSGAITVKSRKFPR